MKDFFTYICILLVLFIFCCSGIYGQDNKAQDEYDIVYLKNGKTLKGIILKQELGTVSIQITDSTTFQKKVQIYQQSEIKKLQKRVNKQKQTLRLKEGKINKGNNSQPINVEDNPSSDPQDMMIPDKPNENRLVEKVVQTEIFIQIPTITDGTAFIDGNKSGDPSEYFDPYSVPRPKRREQIWNRDIRGFRAFLDYAYIQGIGKDRNHRFEYMNSVGFQFNPIFYVGVAAGYDLTLNSKESSVPVALNPRINFIDEFTTPFWDVKLGYSIGEGKGFYCSTSLGVSFTKQGGRAFNVGIVYSLQKSKYYDWQDNSLQKRIAIRPIYHGLALKVTYEFGIGR